MFITLEGPEGSGKTSQVPQLAKYLRDLGWGVLTTREPGGTDIGDQIRQVLVSMENIFLGCLQFITTVHTTPMKNKFF